MAAVCPHFNKPMMIDDAEFYLTKNTATLKPNSTSLTQPWCSGGGLVKVISIGPRWAR